MPDSTEPLSFSRSLRQSKASRCDLIRLATCWISCGSITMMRMPTMSCTSRSGLGNSSTGSLSASSCSRREALAWNESVDFTRPVMNSGCTSLPTKSRRILAFMALSTDCSSPLTAPYCATAAAICAENSSALDSCCGFIADAS